MSNVKQIKISGSTFDIEDSTARAGLLTKSDIGHNHNGLYYTKTENDALLSNKMNVSGGEFTGKIQVPRISGTSVTDGGTTRNAQTTVFIPEVTGLQGASSTETHLKELLKWICGQYQNYLSCVFEGRVIYSVPGQAIIQIPSTSNVDANGYPINAFGIYYTYQSEIYHFGFTVGAWHYTKVAGFVFGSGSGRMCEGNDPRLSDARPASDVSSWAKQENKPTYAYSEIQNAPTSLSELSEDSTHRTVTDSEKDEWSAVNDIPSIVSSIQAVPDLDRVYKLSGQPSVLFGEGDPSESIVPTNWKQFDPTTEEGYMWNGLPCIEGQMYVNISTGGEGLFIGAKLSNGVLRWAKMTSDIPTASENTKGGIKVGKGLKMTSDVMSVDTVNSVGSGELGKPADSTMIDQLENLKFDKSKVATSFGSTTSNEKVPSEKLVKDTIDAHTAAGNTSAHTPLNVGLGNVDNTSDAVKKANFTGSVSSGSNGFPTGDAVYSAIQTAISGVSGALRYMGSLNGGTATQQMPAGAYTPQAERGHTYKVAVAGKILGESVEVGDMLIANSDVEAATSANWQTIKTHWDFLQGNQDGVVIGPESSINGAISLFDGITGKVIKSASATGNDGTPIYINSDGKPTASTKTLGKSVPSNAVFTDTTYGIAIGGSRNSQTITLTPSSGQPQSINIALANSQRETAGLVTSEERGNIPTTSEKAKLSVLNISVDDDGVLTLLDE